MVRTRFLAAALLALPLAACDVDNSQLPEGAEKYDSASESLGDVRAALAALPSAQVKGSHADGVPFMIEGQLSSGAMRGLASGQPLQNVLSVFRLQTSDMVFKNSRRDEQGNVRTRYSQMKNGLPVFGGELIVHQDASGKVFMANGSARDGEIVPAKARIAPEAALRTALERTEGRHIDHEGDARLAYLRGADDKLQLVYAVMVTGEGQDLPIREQVFVSALDGSIVDRVSEIHSAKNRAVYTGNNTSSLPGTLKRSEGGAATSDAHVDDNYTHLGTTYDCYKTNFNRDSYNGAGAQLRSTVHHQTNYTNAFWNGSQMVYGDSDNVQSAPLGKSLDVTVHELTHAVTSSESNLVYSNESGALNEGMSDIFAAYCESWTLGWTTPASVWMIGDDVWTPNTAGDALRYMGNPTQDGSSKDYYPTRYIGSSDNGGVHWNSGIANLAFKLLVTGGTHPRGVTTTAVTGIGMQKAGAIFYKANVDLMTSGTTFAQARTYMESAAGSLNGAGSVEQVQTGNAWSAVGVLPPAAAQALTNNVAKTGLTASTGSSLAYYLDVPASKKSTFTTSGGSGDADLYVKAGSAASTTSYDCRSENSTNSESCSIAAKSAATRIYVTVYAYSTFSSVSLKGVF